MDKKQAIASWTSILSEENIITTDTVLEKKETATYLTDNKICAVLRPSNSQEIKKCLHIANEHKIPIYPVSTGKNWGYGSKVPTGDGCALMELKKMNKIIDFNEELGYVTIEPGVTQQQLYEFLQEKKSNLWLDCNASSVESSLIGNTMERGFGHTPYGDHFAQVCGMEVVLPTGEIIHTGFGKFENATAAPVYRWGLGPYLDGLFTQSNFGIVTQMTFWLMPAPEYFEAFFFSVERDDQLADLIDALRPLRLDGTIKSAVHIGNNYKVLCALRQYPWEEAKGVTPLPDEVLNQFAKDWDFGAWNGSGGIYGTKKQVAEAKRLINNALKGKVRRIQFLDDRTIKIADGIAKPFQKITGSHLPELLDLMHPVYGLMKGVPTSTQLASTYWRKKTPIPENPDPDRDGCGLIWCAPVAPLLGKHGAKINQIVRETLLKYGFEPQQSITLLTERVLDCVISIGYDRDIQGEDQRALECYDELMDKLTSSGYYPYRLGIHSMKTMAKGEDSYNQLLRQLKSTLDPNNILSPGRYSPE
ncbi:4-cresol dehydrogenase (hydroxylating) [Cyanobacterium sp. HL-69]|uniref:FAD-binding oxidoreductase n=1 Tax=Cyanobacterium sp. HL-69 TaxID=2054282 RepID=UPI000CA0F625|nr:4-cresol dehydrogenase (hydroxylating) [Cyanobacterium sp. HL-69]